MPSFSGDPLEWQTFWDTFETSVHSNQSLSGVQKFQYLRAQLNGPAARTIAGLTPTNRNYQHAIDLLRQRFGQTHKVTAAHMNALLRLNTPSANHRDLRMFYDNICCHIRGQEAAGRATETYGDCLVPIVLDRLPPQVRQQVPREHGSTDWAISPLLEALRREIEVLELVSTSQDNATPLLAIASFASAAERSQREAQPSRHWDSRSRKCVFCSAVHPPQACTSVTDPNRRWDIVRSKRLCYNCLGPHHAAACPTTVRCRTCGKKHHTSLCDPAPPAHRDATSVSRSSTQAFPLLPPPVQTPPTVTEPPDSPMTTGHTTCATSPACLATGEQVILQTAYSTVSGEDGSSMDARLLLDSSSQRTYMSERLTRQLHLQPVLQEPLAVSTFGDTRPFTMDTYVVHFYLLLKDGSRLALSANVVPNITGAIHRGPTPPEDDREAFLRALSPEQLADYLPVSSDAASIDLLLGSDYFWDIVSGDRIALPSGLLLVSSKLGYILTGKCRSFSSQPAKEVGTLFAQTQVLQSIPAPSYTTCADPCLVPAPNLTDFWSLETIGIGDDPSPTMPDAIHRDFKRTIRHVDGRYQVHWPWKDNADDLPDNFGLAVGRLKSLSRRFERDPALLSQYDKVIQNQLNNGIIKLAPPDPPQTSTHYLPHQPVITPNKNTTKLRVVYDASSKTQKTARSLNDCLHRGPVLLPDLCGLLLRCWLSPVVLLADIEKAFLQVGLHPADRDATRFLWYKDPSKPECSNDNLAVYRFCRYPLASSAAPSCCMQPFAITLTRLRTPERS